MSHKVPKKLNSQFTAPVNIPQNVGQNENYSQFTAPVNIPQNVWLNENYSQCTAPVNIPPNVGQNENYIVYILSVLQAEPKWCKRTQCSEITYKTKFLSLYMFAEKQIYRFCKQPPKLHISYEVITLTTSCLTALRQLESTRHTNSITLGEAVSRCEKYSVHCCRWVHSSEQCILLYMFLFAYIHAVPGFM